MQDILPNVAHMRGHLGNMTGLGASCFPGTVLPFSSLSEKPGTLTWDSFVSCCFSSTFPLSRNIAVGSRKKLSWALLSGGKLKKHLQVEVDDIVTPGDTITTMPCNSVGKQAGVGPSQHYIQTKEEWEGRCESREGLREEAL